MWGRWWLKKMRIRVTQLTFGWAGAVLGNSWVQHTFFGDWGLVKPTKTASLKFYHLGCPGALIFLWFVFLPLLKLPLYVTGVTYVTILFLSLIFYSSNNCLKKWVENPQVNRNCFQQLAGSTGSFDFRPSRYHTSRQQWHNQNWYLYRNCWLVSGIWFCPTLIY